jgi:hypothetical protein
VNGFSIEFCFEAIIRPKSTIQAEPWAELFIGKRF